jgi:hypothetical protein
MHARAVGTIYLEAGDLMNTPGTQGPSRYPPSDPGQEDDHRRPPNRRPPAHDVVLASHHPRKRKGNSADHRFECGAVRRSRRRCDHHCSRPAAALARQAVCRVGRRMQASAARERPDAEDRSAPGRDANRPGKADSSSCLCCRRRPESGEQHRRRGATSAQTLTLKLAGRRFDPCPAYQQNGRASREIGRSVRDASNPRPRMKISQRGAGARREAVASRLASGASWSAAEAPC